MYFSKRLAWHISTPVFIDSGNGRGGIFDPSFISLLQLSLSLSLSLLGQYYRLDL